MEELIARFRHWVADCPLDIAFSEGADEAEIAAAETALNLEFPADLRAYLALANGETWNSDGLIGDWQLLELKFIVKEAQAMRSLVEQGDFGDNANPATPAIKGLWWSPRWIPIVTSGSGHLICLDMDPNDTGHAGQVILFLHDDGRRPLVAHSLRAWFARLADDLECGLYEIVKDEYGYQHFNSHALMWSSLEGQDLYEHCAIG